jgi:signal transduction histidine kinase/DNA-binding NarL/FixJ family response regulator
VKRRQLWPHSLRRQFALALAGLALIFGAGGIFALYAVREVAVASRQLAEERLLRVRLAQDLVAETATIALDASQLINADTGIALHGSFERMERHLRNFDAIVTQISTTNGDLVVLDLHQASQLLRNSANVATQLREDSLNTELRYRALLEGRFGRPEAPVAPERLPLLSLLYQLRSATRLDELEALRERLPALMGAAARQPGLAADVRELFAMRDKLIGQHRMITGLRDEISRQSQAMGAAAGTWSTASANAYREAVEQVVDASERHQRWIFALFIGSVLAAVALARGFLGHHVIGRLQEVSQHLRSDHPQALAGNESPQVPVKVPVQGEDEIGGMARAVERFLEDRRQLAQTRASLEIEQQRLAAIIDHTADGILVVRGDRVLQLNPAGERMFGQAPQPAGLAVGELLSGLDPPLEVEQASPRSAVGQHGERRFPVEVSVSRMAVQDGADGEGALRVLVVRDATLRRAAEQQLTAARDTAIAAQRAQSTFLANMSHELRTPLNGILGYTQILRLDNTLDEQQAAGLKTIQSSGEHLLMLINDILDIAKIEAGRLDLVPAPVHPASFFGMIGDLIRIKAQQKNLDFALEIHGELPDAMEIDERRLRQVLLNLLGNAVKFSDHGRVQLIVHLLGVEENRAQLRFEVCDSGIGMDADQLQRLFQPFAQVHDAARRVAGSGLGLSISRQLVRMMGGDILVRSVPEEGSVFWFELAVQVPQTVAGSARVERSAIGYAGAPRSVLIVDDIAENREMLAWLLRLLGFQIDEADNGQTAIARAQAKRPDLILMDMMMPVMDGLQATRHIRADAGLKEVPIIAISASVTAEDRQKWVASGGNGFEAKPVRRESLLRQMGELLDLTWIYRDGDGGAAAAPAEGEPLAPESIPPADELQALHRLTQAGNMAAICDEAERLAQAEARYRPFADRVRRLANEYQVRALATLVKESLAPRSDPRSG